jgi:hypothetical protein
MAELSVRAAGANLLAAIAKLLAIATEILARTEQYFCPIKHARKILGTHSRYQRFLAYGEADAYEEKLEEYRVALGKVK